MAEPARQTPTARIGPARRRTADGGSSAAATARWVERGRKRRQTARRAGAVRRRTADGGSSAAATARWVERGRKRRRTARRAGAVRRRAADGGSSAAGIARWAERKRLSVARPEAGLDPRDLARRPATAARAVGSASASPRRLAPDKPAHKPAAGSADRYRITVRRAGVGTDGGRLRTPLHAPAAAPEVGGILANLLPVLARARD